MAHITVIKINDAAHQVEAKEGKSKTTQQGCPAKNY